MHSTRFNRNAMNSTSSPLTTSSTAGAMVSLNDTSLTPDNDTVICCALPINFELQVIRNVISSVGALANLFVIIVMVSLTKVTTKATNQATNLLIVNQSTIDFTASILTMMDYFLGRIYSHDKPSDQLTCRLWTTALPMFSTFVASTYNILALTLERYVAVIYPVQHKISFTAKKTYWLIAFIWILPTLYEICILVPTTDIVDGCCVPYGVWSSWLAYRIVPVTIIGSIEYYGPIVMMVYCYGRMYIFLRRKVMPLSTAPHGGHNNATNQYDSAMHNILKTMTIVALMFFVCWTPNEMMFILAWWGVLTIDYTSWYYQATVQLMFSYCLINPIIYAVKYKDFRQALSRLAHKVMSNCSFGVPLSVHPSTDTHAGSTQRTI